jgi:hypothetical protein
MNAYFWIWRKTETEKYKYTQKTCNSPFEKNNVIELIFPYSKLEGGGNCVPMYSNKRS